ncbi:hypothetical protein J1TS3_44490 [Siminovitchia fordii]|uniref:Uncharacterized protein n=1 Tax=Siminovitchia fordii TaxID=254759 RepID=A0ABQ4KDW9_9BACI|nr:hypothetical protein J1TS3_44490 [Siminovitchia fordii]
MTKFILPHMYLFFGIILFVLAEFIIPIGAGSFYGIASFVSILFFIIGLIWILILLLQKVNKRSK